MAEVLRPALLLQDGLELLKAFRSLLLALGLSSHTALLGLSLQGPPLGAQRRGHALATGLGERLPDMTGLILARPIPAYGRGWNPGS